MISITKIGVAFIGVIIAIGFAANAAVTVNNTRQVTNLQAEVKQLEVTPVPTVIPTVVPTATPSAKTVTRIGTPTSTNNVHPLTK